MTTLERIFRGWFRSKEWKAKRERRLKQWRDARDKKLYTPPPFSLEQWDSEAGLVIYAKGTYPQVYLTLYSYEYISQPFDVVKVDQKWRHRPSGNLVSCKKLLRYLDREEARRKYPAIFSPETTSDS